MADTAIFDIDGTLVDTNYQHAVAWYRSFRRFDLTVPLWRIHRSIGMGGDQLVTAVAGEQVEREHGDALRDGWTEEYAPMLAEVRPFADARSLLTDVRDRGFGLVLASSGQKDQVDHYLDLLDARSIAQDWTTSADVEHTKPEPDLLRAAMDKVPGKTAVMIGDSTWDCVAAERAGIPSYAVRTGGFSAEELREAGAIEVFESLGELHDRLDDTLLARPS